MKRLFRLSIVALWTFTALPSFATPPGVQSPEAPVATQAKAPPQAPSCEYPRFHGVEPYKFFSKALQRDICSAIIYPDFNQPVPPEGYPLLVLLHGIHGAPSDWFRTPRFHERVAAVRERMGFPNAYIVAPMGINGYWSDSLDGKGPWRTMVVEDLMTELSNAKQFPNISRNPKLRAISGYSMGGFGALSIALEHPGLFGYAVGMSATDMEIAIQSKNQLKAYKIVFGKVENGRRSVDPAYIAKLNPYNQLTAPGIGERRGKNQHFYLLNGTADARKFTEGTQRLADLMRSRHIDVTHQLVEGGGHSFKSSWTHQEMERWLEWLGKKWLSVLGQTPALAPTKHQPAR